MNVEFDQCCFCQYCYVAISAVCSSCVVILDSLLFWLRKYALLLLAIFSLFCRAAKHRRGRSRRCLRLSFASLKMSWSSLFELVAELADGKTTFSKKELKELGVKGLTYYSYVETTDGKYFHPIKKSNISKVYEVAVTAKVRACDGSSLVSEPMRHSRDSLLRLSSTHAE